MGHKRNESTSLEEIFAALANSSTIHSGQELEATRASTDCQIDKTWSTHARKYHSALKRKEILTHATTRMDSGDIVLREIARLKRTNTV